MVRQATCEQPRCNKHMVSCPTWTTSHWSSLFAQMRPVRDSCADTTVCNLIRVLGSVFWVMFCFFTLLDFWCSSQNCFFPIIAGSCSCLFLLLVVLLLVPFRFSFCCWNMLLVYRNLWPITPQARRWIGSRENLKPSVSEVSLDFPMRHFWETAGKSPHGFPSMVSLWFPCDFPVISLWFPMVPQWFPPWFPQITWLFLVHLAAGSLLSPKVDPPACCGGAGDINPD